MNKLGITLLSVFLCLVAFYLLILKPEKYEEIDIYDSIMEKGIIRVGINIDSKPFGFKNEKGEICGYDADLARYVAEHITGNRNNVKFIPVTLILRIDCQTQ